MRPLSLHPPRQPQRLSVLLAVRFCSWPLLRTVLFRCFFCFLTQSTAQLAACCSSSEATRRQSSAASARACTPSMPRPRRKQFTTARDVGRAFYTRVARPRAGARAVARSAYRRSMDLAMGTSFGLASASGASRRDKWQGANVKAIVALRTKRSARRTAARPCVGALSSVTMRDGAIAQKQLACSLNSTNEQPTNEQPSRLHRCY